jgi:NTP pyrophosphatase (non-canonical NTP hydrolase)
VAISAAPGSGVPEKVSSNARDLWVDWRMTIAEIQLNAKELCAKHEFKDRNPDQRFRYLVSEVGELSTELLRLQWKNDDHAEVRRNVGHEIYDIVWNLCDLANLLDIDLERAFAEKAELSRRRVWSNPT